MLQLVQILGAIAILVAFTLAQFDVLEQRSYLFLALNLVGAAVLAVLAYVEEQWGFLLLEAVWAAVSAWSLSQVLWRLFTTRRAEARLRLVRNPIGWLSVALSLATAAVGALGVPRWVWIGMATISAACFAVAIALAWRQRRAKSRVASARTNQEESPAAFTTSEGGETIIEGGSVSGYDRVTDTKGASSRFLYRRPWIRRR